MGNNPQSLSHSLPPGLASFLDRLDAENFSKRLWAKDASLWKAEPAHQKIIQNALGWLEIPRAMLARLDEVQKFARELRRAGFRHAVVLGMGGSSLCPDVCRATFGSAPGFLELQVLDSTLPASVLKVERALDLDATLFIVSSKSGGTVEPLSFFKYFYERVRAVTGERAGEKFIAITDPGTSLEQLAREKNFRRVFPGEPDIGGRYSALSNFGMVPAALAGVDIQALLESGARLAAACGPEVPARENPGATLGAALAQAARDARDKLTFVISPGIETFADWAEQLVAESSGKEGEGIVPVAGEDLGAPEVYGRDRLFVYLRLVPQKAGVAYQDDAVFQKLHALEKAGHPVLLIEVASQLDLGQEFFRWEVATATACSLLGIDAFDQPNVQESKDNTNRLLARFRAEGKLDHAPPLLQAGELEFYAGTTGHFGRAADSLAGSLSRFLKQRRVGQDYIALMAYLERTPEHDALLREIRLRLRDALHVATTLGYGPRFLHSTGQLHKGGANNGLFIQITGDDARDLAIPGEPYSFSVLAQAQAQGDLEALQSKSRRVVRLHLSGDPASGLRALSKLLASIL